MHIKQGHLQRSNFVYNREGGLLSSETITESHPIRQVAKISLDILGDMKNVRTFAVQVIRVI